jgi:hypothetical protein
MSSDHEQRFEVLADRVNGLRQAVRLDNFRSAQRLRAGLGGYLKDLKGPLRDDVAHLFEMTGVWLRNVDDRHEAKRQVQKVVRRIVVRLRGYQRSDLERQSLERRVQAMDCAELPPYRPRRRGSPRV